MLLRLDHVQLAMPEGREAEARTFYVDVLGLAEVPKPANLAKRGGCWFPRGEVRVHLGVEAGFQPARKAHPAFVVADLKATRLRLVSFGIECRDDEPLEEYQRTYVQDPFGNRIQLMEAL